MFSSAMAIIVEDGFMTKSQTGMINAVYWFVYALFQVFGGFAVDKYSPYKLIMIGLAGAAVSNLIIYFNQSYYVMMASWTFNAIIQFGVWPGVFKIVSTKIAPSMRSTAVFWLLFSTSVGLGMSMLIASFVGHWKQNFLVSVISLLIMIGIIFSSSANRRRKGISGKAL
jgi:sugar phosphate permease